MRTHLPRPVLSDRFVTAERPSLVERSLDLHAHMHSPTRRLTVVKGMHPTGTYIARVRREERRDPRSILCNPCCTVPAPRDPAPAGQSGTSAARRILARYERASADIIF